MGLRALTSVLVTGGAGFIGSTFVRHLLAQPDFAGRVVNLDALTYAGHRANLEGLADEPRHRFVHGDIRDADTVRRLFEDEAVDAVVHLAAESHVDRSIRGPADFITTNILGTFTLLEAARRAWAGRRDVVFHHVSTDEVYGSLGPTGRFTETSPYDPRSPYSASKAAADHLVRAYGHTYGLPVSLSNGSNNYGPRQHPEKLIPLTILHLLEGRPVPIYGDGQHVRDWLHVEDHATALWRVLADAPAGGTWNVGGGEERTNLEIVERLCTLVAERRGEEPEVLRRLLCFVEDRPGHDRRYAIDGSRIRERLGWHPRRTLDEALGQTVDWYLAHPEWLAAVRGDARAP